MNRLIVLFFILLCGSGCFDTHLPEPLEMVFFDDVSVGEVPSDLQVLLWGDQDAQRDYYTKYIDAGGVAIVGHASVEDEHFYKAREIFLIMTSERPEIRERLTPYQERRFSMKIFTRDSPPLPTFGQRAGWCGRTCYAQVGFPTNYYVLVHEFGHAMHYAIRELDPTFQARLEDAYAEAYAGAIEEWSPGPDVYTQRDNAMKNDREYWAEGVVKWFMLDHFHNEFLALDPILWALLDEWLPAVSLD